MTIKLAGAALAVILSATASHARTYDLPPDRHAVSDYTAPSMAYRARTARQHHKARASRKFTVPAILIITKRPEPAIPLPRPRPKVEPTADVALVANAKRYLGMTAAQIGVRRTLWCSAFLRMVTKAKGVSDLALSWLSKPRSAPRIGVIAVLRRGHGMGHVGIVSGFDRRGNPVIISGNHGNRVAESVYARQRVLAWVRAM